MSFLAYILVLGYLSETQGRGGEMKPWHRLEVDYFIVLCSLASLLLFLRQMTECWHYKSDHMTIVLHHALKPLSHAHALQ